MTTTTFFITETQEEQTNTSKHSTLTWSLPSCIRPFHDAVNLRLSTEQLITLQGKHTFLETYNNNKRNVNPKTM